MTKRDWFLHRLYLLGIGFKGIDGILEIIGGALFLCVNMAALNRLVVHLTQHELVEDPQATHLRAAVGHLSPGNKLFGSAYLLGHGAIKVFLVWGGLLRRKLWAFPAALLFLGAFIIYQAYRLLHRFSFGLAALTVIDLIVLLLIWREYGTGSPKKNSSCSIELLRLEEWENSGKSIDAQETLLIVAGKGPINQPGGNGFIMKTHICIYAIMMAAGLVLAGCSKEQQQSSTSTVDTAALEKNFKSAEPAVQTSADKAVAAIKAGDYSGAMTELKTLASNAKLTPEQQQAVKDTIAQAEKAITEAATKAKDATAKAVEDVKKAVPK